MRLTRAEMEIICFGLTKIEANYRASQNPGGYTFTECRPAPAGFTDDSVAEQMAVLARARELVCRNSQATKRLHLTAIELSACALGVRVTNFWDRKKNVHWKRRNHSATLRHLLVKIEKQRKVAKRRHIRILGKTNYVATQGRWRKHIAWMRAVYVSAFQARTKRLLPYRRNAVRKTCITNWVKWVQSELSLQDLAPIPEKEIKKEVQKALHAARRRGIGFSVLDPGREQWAAEWFAKKLKERIIKPAWGKRHAEILDRIHAVAPWTDKGESDGKEAKGKIKDTAQPRSPRAQKQARKA
ncbi:MAG: hypothetical protein P4N24_00180 [Acidobacteriota bacterium]|nr:hypothetical protein [Acidobacteriota bacterium]